MIIKLSDRNMPATLSEQSAKVDEETAERREALDGGQPGLDRYADEGHIAKIRRREANEKAD